MGLVSRKPAFSLEVNKSADQRAESTESCQLPPFNIEDHVF